MGKTAVGGDLGVKVSNSIYIELPIRTLSSRERVKLEIGILKSVVYKCM